LGKYTTSYPIVNSKDAPFVSFPNRPPLGEPALTEGSTGC